MEDKSDTVDRRIDEIARRQHGVITSRQLEVAGLGRRGASRRAAAGRLHRLHRGVYAVGHRAPSWHGRWMAAVLACGEGAVLSHHCAAALWGLLRPIEGAVHVSVPAATGRKRRPGIHLHRCPALRGPSAPSRSQTRGGRGGRLTTFRDGIPVTTIERTIEDLDRCVPPHLVRRAIRQAEHRGVRLERTESDRTRSDLETAFLDLYRRHRISPPEVNVKIGRWEVDFLWREQRLVVEVDAWTYHRGSVSFEDDHARDLDLRSAGFTVLRFTDRQIEDEPERVVEVVREALS
jgi:very-short-patch-repair endonuclease